MRFTKLFLQLLCRLQRFSKLKVWKEIGITREREKRKEGIKEKKRKHWRVLGTWDDMGCSGIRPEWGPYMGLGLQGHPNKLTAHPTNVYSGECHLQSEIKSSYSVGCSEHGFRITWEKWTPQIWYFLMLDKMCKVTHLLVWGFPPMLQIAF